MNAILRIVYEESQSREPDEVLEDLAYYLLRETKRIGVEDETVARDLRYFFDAQEAEREKSATAVEKFLDDYGRDTPY